MVNFDNKKVNVLGTDYEIKVKKYEEDDYFKEKECGGYCGCLLKQIVICDMATYKGWEHEEQKNIDIQMKLMLRHEIVHAFFEESGLFNNSNDNIGAWARNEEMIDWIALQGGKIYKAWKEVDAI